MVNFLHISDLHYDKKDEEQGKIIDAFLDDLTEIGKNRSVDFVVFSGDLVGIPTEECFMDVDTYFVNPLMEKLGIPKDRFIMVPGNHEVQKLNEVGEQDREKNLKDMIKSSNKINDLINDLLDGKSKEYITKLNNYNSYISNIYSTESTDFIHEYNSFCSVHYFQKANLKIGIACFNTCLSCFGKASTESVNKIIFGKRQIEFAINKLRDGDIKIAVFHHPIEWLSSYEMDSIQESLIKEFDIILTGHNHADVARGKGRDKNTSLSNVAGYLYIKGKTDSKYSYFNFNIIDNEKSISGKICYKKFFSKKEAFDIDNSEYEKGEKPFHVEHEHNIVLDRQIPINLDQLKTPEELIEEIRINQTLIDQVIHGKKVYYEHKMLNVEYRNKNIENIDFSSTDLSRSFFNGSSFTNCFFANSNLTGADFSRCHFNEVEFVHVDSLYTVAYLPSKKCFCTGGTGGYIIFLTLNEENGLIYKSFILKGLLARVLSLTWCPIGDLLVSASSNGALELWQPFEDCKPIQVIRNEGEIPIYAVAWSPDGNFLAVAMNRKEIHLYKLVKSENYFLEEVMIFNTLAMRHGSQHSKQILTLAWSPNGKWLVSAGIDKMINIWDVENLDNIKHVRSFLSAHYDYVRKVVWNKSSTEFFSCSDDGTVKLWKYNGSNFNEESSIVIKPSEDNNAILSLAWHPDYNFFAVGLRDDTLALVEYDEKYKMNVISCKKYHKGRIWDLVWDDTGRYLCSIGNEGKLKVYQLLGKELSENVRNEMEIKLNCSGLKLFGATGLDILGYQIAENKDMPWDVSEGTLGAFLCSRGAEGYESEYDKIS